MKIRYGFVTNSSSSSFIIAKFDTVETVYDAIRGFYLDMYKNFDKMVDYCKERKNKHYPQLTKDDNAMTVSFEEKYPYDKKKKINYELENLFGLSSWDYLSIKMKQVMEDCKTYEEFLKNFDKEPPFTIEVFKDMPIDDYSREEIIDWYSDDDLDTYYIDTPENLEKMLQDKVIVCSECGWIADYVVKKLSEISISYCNHMG